MKLPLSGVRVLDLTRALSGPFCTMILGDLGADVIKIEPAPAGDMIRQWGPFQNGHSIYYLSGNRNKRSVGLDFRAPEAANILRRMIGGVDILVENFRVGVMDEMGLKRSDIEAAHPNLIWASITGYGSSGPKSVWPGFDQIAQGESGLMSITGTTESGPQRVGVAIGDLTSGMWAAIGILAALFQQKETGKGQRIETSLLASLVSLLSVQGQRYLSTGAVPGLAGNVHPVIAPYGAFETQDGLINIGAATQQQWEKLARLLNLLDLISDSRFIDNATRIENRDRLKVLIEEKLSAATRSQWIPQMVQLGIPAGSINNMHDVFTDEQILESGIIEALQNTQFGTFRQVGSPIGMNSLAGKSIRRAPPLMGEHSREILTEFGYTDNEVDSMIQNQIVLQAQQ